MLLLHVAYFKPKLWLERNYKNKKAGWLAMHISDSVPSASGGRELFSMPKQNNCISAGVEVYLR